MSNVLFLIINNLLSFKHHLMFTLMLLEVTYATSLIPGLFHEKIL